MATRYPVSSVVTVRDAMDRLFNQAFNANQFETIWPANGQRNSLPLDVYATEDEVVVLAAVPGIAPESVDITVEKNTVTLSGEMPNVARSEGAKEANWYLHELPRGKFRRSLQLPYEIDATTTTATFEHGMIRLRLPKAEAARPRQIRIEVGGSTESTVPEVAESAASSNGESESGN